MPSETIKPSDSKSPYDIVNVSRGLSAKISSPSQWSTPQDDLDIFQDSKRNFSIHTKMDEIPFLSLDLGKIHHLENIRVFNRRDGHQYQARSLIVEASANGEDWAILHQGSIYWQSVFEIPLSGMVHARHLRFRLNEPAPLHLRLIEVNARIYTRFGGPVFIARRTDGLGERLNALVNAVWLSEMMGGDFKFSWSDRFLNDASHAITPVERMFSPDFIARRHLPMTETGDLWEVTGSNLEKGYVQWRLAQEGAILSPRTHLSNHFAKAPEARDPEGAARAFRRLEFSDEVEQAVRVARREPIPNSAVAVHLRSGDIFFGEYRKYLHYTYKGLTMPIAKAAIQHFHNEGREVFLFGQDAEQMDYLSRTCGATNALMLNQSEVSQMERHQKAMYDLVLMSRFKTILGGSSGFIRQAASIGGSELISIHKILNIYDQHRISMEDLKKNAEIYHPLQTAFAYWYAYFYGRQGRSTDQNIEILRQAIRFDPENELYVFVLAALLHPQFEESSRVLETMFAERSKMGRLSEVFRVFTAKTSGVYNLKEFFPQIAASADMGSFFHACLMLSLAKAEGNRTLEDKYARTCKNNDDNIDWNKYLTPN